MNKVSIILLNYNGKKFNKHCIESILLQTYTYFEIIFVDNSSTDWSLEEIKNLYQNEIHNKKIVIIENKKNTWFSWGNNLWVEHASKESKYICLLNNDTTVLENRLEELIKGIESDNTLWGVGSIILNKWMEDKIKNEIFNNKYIAASSFFWENVWKKINDKEFQKGIFYTSAISWCCFLYRRDIINIPFEDYYFAYAEDTFLSRIILLLWYNLAIVWNSIVHHLWSGSFKKSPSDFKLFYWNRNQIINFLVFYSFWTKIKLFFLFILIQTWHIFINEPFKRVKAKYKAWLRIYKNWSKIKKTRNYIKSNTTISEKYFLSKLSYKFNDEMFFIEQKQWQSKIIKYINKLFKIYCILLFIPHSE